jgi:hypothetical protein
MLWSQFSAIFLQFSAKKLADFSKKNNVTIKFIHNLALFWVESAIFFADFFWRKHFKKSQRQETLRRPRCLAFGRRREAEPLRGKRTHDCVLSQLPGANSTTSDLATNRTDDRCYQEPFLTSPLAPRSELDPLGWTLSPRGNVHPFVHPQGWTLSTA